MGGSHPFEIGSWPSQTPINMQDLSTKNGRVVTLRFQYATGLRPCNSLVPRARWLVGCLPPADVRCRVSCLKPVCVDVCKKH